MPKRHFWRNDICNFSLTLNNVYQSWWFRKRSFLKKILCFFFQKLYCLKITKQWKWSSLTGNLAPQNLSSNRPVWRRCMRGFQNDCIRFRCVAWRRGHWRLWMTRPDVSTQTKGRIFSKMEAMAPFWKGIQQHTAFALWEPLGRISMNGLLLHIFYMHRQRRKNSRWVFQSARELRWVFTLAWTGYS